MNKDYTKLEILNANIGFCNFSGRPDKYNPNGKRSFAVFLTPDEVGRLIVDGWAIKQTKPRDEETEGQYYLNVGISSGDYFPKAYLINDAGRVRLTEETIGEIDFAERIRVDLLIRPYYWEYAGTSGKKAMLHSIAVTIKSYEFDRLYSDVQPFDTEETPF